MYIRVLLSCLLLCLSIFAWSQESKTYQKYKNSYKYTKGYIINLDSVKIEGLIKDNPGLNESRPYIEVVFVPKEGKKVKYYPKDIIGYGYYSHQFVSYDDSFYEKVSSGPKVELYRIVSVGSYGNFQFGSMPSPGSYPSESYYVKKIKDPKFTEVRKKKFSQIFSEYFSDCDSVKQKIENEILTEKDIRKIINEYNWCK